MCNLDISPTDQAKGCEIMSAFLISTSCCPYANMLVIPPMAGLRHPVNDVIIGKSDNESPSFTDLCYITVNLM